VKTYLLFDGEFVKIGKSANPKKRLATFQTASAASLHLITVIDGDVERELHTRFASTRVRGEWFFLSYELRMFITETTGNYFPVPFFTWLSAQKDRKDVVGQFAVIALSDRKFPRRANRLHLLMQHYPLHQKAFRKVAKLVHREWREFVRTGKRTWAATHKRETPWFGIL